MNLRRNCLGTGCGAARALGLPVRREWMIDVPAPPDAPAPAVLPPQWRPEPEPERAPEEAPA